MKVNFKLNTNGEGFWTHRAAEVQITGLELCKYQELRVYFDPASWNCENEIIYTDPLFEEELKAELKRLGMGDDICYSESGMQGRDYVSFDAGDDFVKTWKGK